MSNLVVLMVAGYGINDTSFLSTLDKLLFHTCIYAYKPEISSSSSKNEKKNLVVSVSFLNEPYFVRNYIRQSPETSIEHQVKN